jgi:NADH-quinone oxidoreductase subunit E
MSSGNQNLSNNHGVHEAVTAEKVEFTPENLAEAKRYISHFPQGKQKSAILSLLHLAQAQWGWLSVPVQDYVASLLNIEPIEVYEVSTFYTMFHLKPTGKYVLEVCRTGPCVLMGAEETIERIETKLGIKVGETTVDGLFTLKTVECLAACGFAPIIQIHEKYHEHMSPDNAEKLIDELTEKGK